MVLGNSNVPAFNKDKPFEDQDIEYLEWCLDEADARVLQYASQLRYHIGQARKELQYKKAAEGSVKKLEEIVERRREKLLAEEEVPDAGTELRS